MAPGERRLKLSAAAADHALAEMLLIALMLAVLSAEGFEPAPPAVIAALRAGSGCFSTIEVTNLSGRELAAEIEARLETGALVPLEPADLESGGQARSEPRSEPRGDPPQDALDRSERSAILVAGEDIVFAPHQRRGFRLNSERESGNAWVGVWEADPAGTLPALAAEGAIECISGDQLFAIQRPAALAMRNPWFAGHVAEFEGAVLALVNVSDRAAAAEICYSRGDLYSVPARMPDGRLAELCLASEAVALPPFGSREFPVKHEDLSEFAVHTRGDAIVVVVLRPVPGSTRVYRVDSTIRFGSEVAPGLRGP